MRQSNVMLAFSAGGHHIEMMQIAGAWKGCDVVLATTKREDTKNLNAHFLKDYGRNPFWLAVNFWQSLSVVIKERPRVIVTTGAGLVVPLCYIGKLFGARVVFIESFCRVKEPSISGRIMYRIADLFLVQWEENCAFFPKAEYAGSVF